MKDLSFESVMRKIKEEEPVLNIGRDIYPAMRQLKDSCGNYPWQLTKDGSTFFNYRVRVVDGNDITFSLDKIRYITARIVVGGES